MTTTDRRRAYSAYVTQVLDLCRDNGTRSALKLGRGRPVDDCDGAIHRHLSRLTYGTPARRAHYTLACLIALVGAPAPARPEDDPAAADGEGTDGDSAGASDAETTAAAGPPGGDDNPYHRTAWRRRPNLGTTLATAVRRAGFTPGRTEEALDVLTRVSTDQAHRRLPALIERLTRAHLLPDWAVLLEDLAERDLNPGRVRTRWFDAYYQTLDATTFKDAS